MKKVSSISQLEIEEKWYLVDATGQRIGVLASKVAELLQGKTNPKVRNYHDPKVNVIIINAEKLDITPKRALTKFYSAYSGFPGGLKFSNLGDVMKTNPVRPIESAIKGMLPRTKMGDVMITKLKIYTGSEHPHAGQQPVEIDIKKLNI